ncbi:hypothetical protein BDZ45DRAFT_755029 [Acephala macrosclerotiorum]|nr:hypothetical protein BDZ45DRAFT_755029 [Acephala macrosclerotiorum]
MVKEKAPSATDLVPSESSGAAKKKLGEKDPETPASFKSAGRHAKKRVSWPFVSTARRFSSTIFIPTPTNISAGFLKHTSGQQKGSQKKSPSHHNSQSRHTTSSSSTKKPGSSALNNKSTSQQSSREKMKLQGSNLLHGSSSHSSTPSPYMSMTLRSGAPKSVKSNLKGKKDEEMARRQSKFRTMTSSQRREQED